MSRTMVPPRVVNCAGRHKIDASNVVSGIGAVTGASALRRGGSRTYWSHAVPLFDAEIRPRQAIGVI
jgi:hypothetical protein